MSDGRGRAAKCGYGALVGPSVASTSLAPGEPDPVMGRPPTDLTRLTPLMEISSGRSEVAIGLLDGPVAVDLPAFANSNIRQMGGPRAQQERGGLASGHGTFVASVLCASGGSGAPAICPGCTLLVRPIFAETDGDALPGTTPEELAAAIVQCVDAGARVINLSLAIAPLSPRVRRSVELALDHAARRAVILVVAAGNQGTVGGSAIVSHPWVVPVAACDLRGRTMDQSNLGSSIGRHGLSAPGVGVTGLGVDGRKVTLDGTSTAAPFVTGAIGLLWSVFPTATAGEVKFAITRGHSPRRTTIVPPLLDAWAAYESMLARHTARR